MRWPRRWLRPCFEVALVSSLSGCKPTSPPPGSFTTTVRETLLAISALDPVQQWEAWRKERVRQLKFCVYRLEVSVYYRYSQETYRGTAWRWDTEGYVFTCRHLVPREGLRKEIELWDTQGLCHSAQVVWWDSLADVAILRSETVRGEGLSGVFEPRIPEVGEAVWSMGAPWGLSGTLQEGFVSAEMRQILLAGGRTSPFLQLSLPAQPGSSGSPVVDKSGQLIGMISDIATVSGLYEGVSFAIPALVLQEVWNRYRSFAAKYDTAKAYSGAK